MLTAAIEKRDNMPHRVARLLVRVRLTLGNGRSQHPTEQRRRDARSRDPGEGNDACFLRRVGEPGEQSCRDGPSKRPRFQIPPTRYDDPEDETDEEHLLDVVAAVIHHRRRNGGENGRAHDGACAERAAQRDQQKHDPDAEDDRDQSERVLRRVREVGCAGQPCHGKGEVIERGSVVFNRIVGIIPGVEEDARFDGLIGFVAVHGPPIEQRQPERKRSGCRHKYQCQPNPAGAGSFRVCGHRAPPFNPGRKVS